VFASIHKQIGKPAINGIWFKAVLDEGVAGPVAYKQRGTLILKNK